MKHFASTKVQCVCDNHLFFSTNILYTVCYIGTTSEQQQSIFTHVHHHTVLVCAMNICLNQCLTALVKIYLTSALAQYKENVTHK